jgi:hypothetical protein
MRSSFIFTFKALTIKSRKSMRKIENSHFSNLTYNQYCNKRASTRRTCCVCMFWLLKNIKMSSKYTRTKMFKYSRNVVFIYCQSDTYVKIVKTLVTISDQKPTYLRYERYNREIRITSIWERKMTDCMSWSIKAI